MFAKVKPRTQTPNTQLRQTKLYVSQKDNKLKYEGFVKEAPQRRPKMEFVYMPTPRSLPPPSKTVLDKSSPIPTNKIEQKACQEKDKTDELVDFMSKPGRDMINLIGRVDFCLKTHKLYPHLNVIWNVYGKLLRIVKGKRCENTLLVRNDGPVLQGIYFDFEGELESLNTGVFVELVGRFIGNNRLKTFRVSEVSGTKWQQPLALIENKTSYNLMQNKNK